MGSKVKIGIIGGSGLDNPDLLEQREEKAVDTPYGKPSDSLILGKIKGIDCILLARHGRGHKLNPTNVNYRANVWAMKEEGCTHLIVTTACGSLNEDYAPGDIVVIDQFIDRTQKRMQTFYDGAETSPPGVCHIPLHTPFCKVARKMLIETADELGIKNHKTGTMISIEGPRFSSMAESKLFKSWGAHCINMTTVPEVVLAKEIGLCYAAIALVTDYDSWRDDVSGEEHANVESILKTFKENAKKAINIILHVIPKIAAEDWTATIKQYKDEAQGSVMLPH